MSDVPPEDPSLPRPGPGLRLRRRLLGAPRSLADRGLFHKLSLVPFLAWVGLGADGLSSSSYGPDEAFRALGDKTYLALAVAALMALTIAIIAAAYSLIIERFPHGGGGYIVASKLLGEKLGLVSGCALLVDYVLTIAVSIAAAGGALFSFLPPAWHGAKLPIAVLLIAGLTLLNLRGVRESVVALVPVFLLFVVTHIILIVGGIVAHAPQLPETAVLVGNGFREGLSAYGAGGLLLAFMFAYSLGGGTYTGLEAVSNGMPLMREPRIRTARRTMLYMAASLAFTAAGLMVCYLLWQVVPVEGKTMNAVLVERFVGGWSGGHAFVIATLVSEGALLVVGAQAGFLDGPRILSNMAIDSWVPRRFASMSERLTTQNGILLMGAAALAALLYTRGNVTHLVVMYSINVFLTFSLSLLGMLLHTTRSREPMRHRRRRAVLFATGLLLCVTILGVTVYEKFSLGGWLTLVVTGLVVVLCMAVRRHYRGVAVLLKRLYLGLESVPITPLRHGPCGFDSRKPTAAVLVAAYGGLGIHTVLQVFREFPGHFHNLVFVSAGVVDSGAFKGEESLADLQGRTDETLGKYLELARRLNVPAVARRALGTDPVETATELCHTVGREFPGVVFFAGKIIFEQDTWLHRSLHNETARAIQQRLQWEGRTMVVLPARVR
jgi:amino acid transporter